MSEATSRKRWFLSSNFERCLGCSVRNFFFGRLHPVPKTLTERQPFATRDGAIGRAACMEQSVASEKADAQEAKVLKFLEKDVVYWVLEMAIGLDETKCIGAKRLSHDLQGNCCGKRHKAPSTAAKASDLAKDLLGSIKMGTLTAAEATNNGRTEALDAKLEATWGKTLVSKARINELIALRGLVKLLHEAALNEMSDGPAQKEKLAALAARVRVGALMKARDKVVVCCKYMVAGARGDGRSVPSSAFVCTATRKSMK